MRSKTLTDVLKNAIATSGATLYRISKDSGVSGDSLARFMAGRQSLRLDMADRLASYFKLELRRRKGR